MTAAALYARVSTRDQDSGLETQLHALRRFAEARGWRCHEYTDRLSGAKDDRPGLAALLVAARRRHVGVVVCTKLDRIARSVRHLIALAAELEALGVHLVALDQAIDTTTPTGRLLFHVLAAIAEFERELIKERVIAGIRRAQEKGATLGRPVKYRLDPAEAARLRAEGLSLREISRRLLPGVAPQPILIRRALQRAAMAGTNPAPEAP